MIPGEADRLRIEVLGRVRVWRGDRELPLGPPNRQAVLAVLALRANRTVSRSEIVDAVWDEPPPSAVHAVHVHVAELRRVLEPERRPREAGRLLVASGSGYFLRLAPGQLDADVFAEHLDDARRLWSAGDPAALDAYDAAIALWQGTPLAGVQCPWADAERARLTERGLTALEDRAAARLALGEHAGLVAELSGLAAEHPLRERVRALLMTALYRAGRQADALAVYAETRRLLVDELGIEPGRQLQRVHQDILNNQSAPLAPEPVTGPARAPAQPVVPRQLPPAVRHFVGRSAELETLARLLDDATQDAGGAVVISAIDGTAGIGKTALAVCWAHRIADRFPDGQLYVNLRGFDPTGAAMTPAEVVRAFLDALEVPPERVPVGLGAQVGLYRSLLAGRRVLVLLDNARDAEQVRPLLPGSPGCLVVVTSRNQLHGLIAAEGAHPLTLDLLDDAEARQLLTRHVGGARAEAEPGAVADIIARCARLPLALAIVGARAATYPTFPLAVLADELREARGRLDALADSEPADDVRAIFSWSYDALSDGSARMFRLLGLVAGPEVGTAGAASLAGLPLEDVRPLLAELTRAHLVDERSHGRFGYHDLLRAYATELAHARDSVGDRQAARRRVLDHYLHSAYAAAMLLNPHRKPITVPPPDPAVTLAELTKRTHAMAWFTAEHAALLGVIEQAAAEGLDAHAWQLAWAFGDFLQFQGHWQDSIATQRLAVEASERAADRPAEARALCALGSAYARVGRYGEAHDSLGRGRKLYAALGDHLGHAIAHSMLAEVFDLQGRGAEALHHALQALELFRASGYRRGEAGALNSVGWYFAQLCDYRQALVHCEQALAVLQEIGDRYAQAAVWDSIGYAHHHVGDFARATDCYGLAADLCREFGDRSGEAQTLVHLGDARLAGGQPDAARRAWDQAMAILNQLEHPDAEQVRDKLRALRRA